MFNIKKSIEKKNEIQEKAVSLLYKYSKILLSWATGCGKTLASLKMLKFYIKHYPNARGYIICKEEAHLINWEEDIIEHDMTFVNKISTKFLYDSLHKYEDKGVVDFVILDECHAITGKRLAQLKKIIGPDTLLILLSATVDGENQILLKRLINYYEYHISISDAIENEILPPPTVYIHKYQLSPYQKLKYDEITREIEFWKEKYNNKGREFYKIKMVNAGSRRKRFMAECKTSIAKQLIKEEFENTRFICFTGSKEQCDELGKSNSIHSGKSKKSNSKKRIDFNNDKIHKLFVVNMFKEAMNLVNIQKGLIVQLDNVKLSFIQMLGRVFRSKAPEMHIIVLSDTKDEHYLKNVMEGFNQEYVININYDNEPAEKVS